MGKYKAEKQSCATDQAVLPACMYTEVGRGLGGNGGCILHEHSCCGDMHIDPLWLRLTTPEHQRLESFQRSLSVVLVCLYWIPVLLLKNKGTRWQALTTSPSAVGSIHLRANLLTTMFATAR